MLVDFIRDIFGMDSWVLVRAIDTQLYKGRVFMSLEDGLRSAEQDTTVIALLKTKGPIRRVVLIRGDRLK